MTHYIIWEATVHSGKEERCDGNLSLLQVELCRCIPQAHTLRLQRWYAPCFIPSLTCVSVSDAACTFWVARAIAGTLDKSDPLGPVNCLCVACITIFSIHTQLVLICVIYLLLNIFRVINVCVFSQLRKYFNDKNFPKYGI